MFNAGARLDFDRREPMSKHELSTSIVMERKVDLLKYVVFCFAWEF